MPTRQTHSGTSSESFQCVRSGGKQEARSSEGRDTAKLATLTPVLSEDQLDGGDYLQTLDRCLAQFGWAEKVGLKGKLIEGRYHGVGVGCFIEGGAMGPRENARMVLEGDGSVSVYVGSTMVAQGLETICRQIAADAVNDQDTDVSKAWCPLGAVVRQAQHCGIQKPSPKLKGKLDVHLTRITRSASVEVEEART